MSLILIQAVAKHFRLCDEEFRLAWEGQNILPEDTPAALNTEDMEHIDCHLYHEGGKPVIYLFPPTRLPSVDVALTLSPSWDFSALYPVVDVTESQGKTSTASWTVSAGPNGNLVELSSDLSLTYLFWEAHTTGISPRPPSLTRIPLTLELLTPLTPPSSLRPSAFSPSPPSSLTSTKPSPLSRSTPPPATTSLPTGSLPSPAFSKAASSSPFGSSLGKKYEQAAKLAIESRPAVVTRVFMLLKGVEDAEGWKKAEEVDGVREVRVEVEKVGDERLFRLGWRCLPDIKVQILINWSSVHDSPLL
ncbi:hypothetical protein JCM11641_001655 [Rhodosporidiobolus odoratus]